ncbi:hypothetical protein [Streptomyces luteocolor]|uniref:hypothetical protein n=1 Tax=Streptomyces luteocolor TaxID=285500 RepID=UPI00085305A7|nr:hypothetical protein [Streptomyces luteocolor]
MTQSPTPSIAPAGPARTLHAPGRARHALRWAAGIACVPYLTLKIAWILGSRVGIPEGSSLLDHRALMIVANGVTVLMDATVVVLALLLTRPWGLRTPAWLLAAPMWIATGLLTPIMAGYPLQLLLAAFGVGGEGLSADGASEPFLADWVFAVVYTGFIVQGIALGSLFALYARDRWGHLWRGRIRDVPRPGGRWPRILASAAALLALLPVTLHLLWAAGSTAGLDAARAKDRTADFHVLEALDALYLVAAVAGALVLVFRRLPGLPVKVPLALAWAGSGAVGCWGGWLLLASLLRPADDLAARPTAPTLLAYSVQMIIGLCVAAAGLGFLRERAGSTT